MESDIVLYGASGHCKVIIELILSSDKFKINSIIDDNENTKNVFNYDVKHSKHFEFKCFCYRIYPYRIFCFVGYMPLIVFLQPPYFSFLS